MGATIPKVKDVIVRFITDVPASVLCVINMLLLSVAQRKLLKFSTNELGGGYNAEIWLRILISLATRRGMVRREN